jgi:hypothetical protein
MRTHVYDLRLARQEAGRRSLTWLLPACAFVVRPQENVATFCALAREYDIAEMTRTAEDWLIHAAKSGAILQFAQQLKPLPLRMRPLVAAGSTSSDDSQAAARQAAALRFVNVLALARDYKLKRFARTATACVRAMSQEDAHLLVLAELNEAVKR